MTIEQASSTKLGRAALKVVGRSLPLAGLTAVALAACSAPGSGESSEGGEKTATVVAPEQQGVIQFDSLAADKTQGTYTYRDVALKFDSEAHDGVDYVTLDLRGMKLSATFDNAGIFDVDGFNSENGSDTSMTEMDRAIIHTFEVALTDTYRERGSELPALDSLNRMVTVWGDYPSSLPLTRTFYGRKERLVNINLCNNVNKIGMSNWKAYQRASHDCLTIKHAFSDCAAITAGCMYGDDSSTVDNVFMSMHPGATFFGSNASNYRAYGPDHDPNAEFAYGDCFGRCGSECGGSTQFTQACLDHDLCVRFGHISISGECDDEFLDAAVDYGVASNCGNVNFRVAYNWQGTSLQSNCPTSYNNTNDGCDIGCQFTDGDCFRVGNGI